MDDNSNISAHISAALQATLDPRVPNNVRQQALQHLEAVKSQPDAPQHGFALADDFQQDNAVRYYGLQLLEFAVRYRWNEYTADQTDQLRTWVKCLAGSLREQDARLLRNKIAQLWVEVAKRCWGDDEWMDMDQLLLNMWEADGKGASNKLLVLGILEALSEDIINHEDAVAGLRLDVLGHALNEIMIPAGLYAQHAQTRGARQEVRCGGEGWLARMCEFFSLCVQEARNGRDVALYEACAMRALNAIRPTMSWINLKAAEETNCVECLFVPLHTDNVPLQTAAIEVLYALLSRPYNVHFKETWTHLLKSVLRQDRMVLVRRAFEHAMTGPGEDDEKYTLLKKMSEMLSVLADAIAMQNDLVDESVDLPAVFDLLLIVLQHKSLTVSIPVLHSWTKMVNAQEDAIVDLVLAALPTLLQVCSERLLRYEALPEDSEDEISQYLAEDFDTIPERHAFLGNYRRYCTTIITSIARSRPIDALSLVLQEMQSMLEYGPYTSARGFDSTNYSRNALPVLKFDAQFNVVSSALRGYSAWTGDVAEITPEQSLYMKVQKDSQQASESLQQWSSGLINIHTDDPAIAEQVLCTLVMVLRYLRSPPPNFVLSMVQHLLTMRLYDQPAHTAFSDAVGGFEALRVVELQKMALSFPNALLEVYHELEPRIEVLVQKHADDQRLVWGYKAFLFMIIHRATAGIDKDMRIDKLRNIMKPAFDAWTEPELTASVASLQSFCNAIGMDDLPSFYKLHHFDTIQDWSSTQLNESGVARQASIISKANFLPLRMTKSMLSATTEKLKPNTLQFEVANYLWTPLIPRILPNLLQMLRHAQAFHNLTHWSHLPAELQAVVKRTLQDRFWQSGISNESKDEFYARISGSKSSFEGFASTVRGTMRNVREQGYHILYLMTKFEEQFYGLGEGFPEMLAEVLFEDAGCLSANHLHPIINLTTGLVQRCPPHLRRGFLPPVLRGLFQTMDKKISGEWEAIGQAAERNEEDETGLGDEMRTESVLRQLTFSMVSFVPFLLEFDRQAPPSVSNGHRGHPISTAEASTMNSPTLSDLLLQDPSLLEPLILFCTHALRTRDTRCCSLICKVFKSIIPIFANSPPAGTANSSISPETITTVREFISTEVLKACIESLHEPYFAELQKDLASVIASILQLYGSLTGTPKGVLEGLPGVGEGRVGAAMDKLRGMRSERGSRGVVLELLEGVRGRGVAELGRVDVGKAKAKTEKKWMTPMVTEEAPRGGGDELEGIAGLFGEG